MKLDLATKLYLEVIMNKAWQECIERECEKRIVCPVFTDWVIKL